MLLRPIPEEHDVDPAVFHDEIVPQHRPAVLRGLVRDWPMVQHAFESDQVLINATGTRQISHFRSVLGSRQRRRWPDRSCAGALRSHRRGPVTAAVAGWSETTTRYRGR